MAKRELLFADDMEALLSDHEVTVTAIDHFLFLYSDTSKLQYRSAINDLLFNDTETLDVTELTFEHYKKNIPENPKEFTNKQKYKNRFFQYLFAMDYLKYPNDFETIMHKANLVKEFSKNNKNTKSAVNEEKSLTIEELIMIQNIIETDSTKHETLKMQFCWYAIFELGLPVDEIRKSITSDSYSNGQIKTSLDTFPIPEKFNQMFLELSQRDYNGFAIIDVYIANLGIDAKLKRKLLPSMIKQARTNSMVKCGNCFESFPNLTDNWLSVNNRIVCVACANELKKN